MQKTIGPKFELDTEEQILIADDIPALVSMTKESWIGSQSLIDDLSGVKGVRQGLAIPYLTNRRVVLYLLVISEELGVFGRWWELPLEYIKGVKFGKQKKGGVGSVELNYKVPEIQKSVWRQALGLGRGVERFKVTLHTRSILVWKTQITKLLFTVKAVKLKEEIENLERELAEARTKLQNLEAEFKRGDVTEAAYKRLKSDRESEVAGLSKRLEADKQELREVTAV